MYCLQCVVMLKQTEWKALGSITSLDLSFMCLPKPMETVRGVCFKVCLLKA